VSVEVKIGWNESTLEKPTLEKRYVRDYVVQDQGPKTQFGRCSRRLEGRKKRDVLNHHRSRPLAAGDHHDSLDVSALER
jgi:hypothetical protein